MTTPLDLASTDPVIAAVAALSGDVADLQSQQTTFVQGTATAISVAASTFTASIPSQSDGSTIVVAGIPSPPQFLPDVGAPVTLAVAGAVPVYQPAQVATGALTPSNVNTNAAGAPTGLTLSTAAGTNSGGGVTATVTASWTAPTTTASGTAPQGTLTYLVHHRVTGQTVWQPVYSAVTTVSFLVPPGGSQDVQVAAVDQLGNVGPFTATVSITSGTDTTAPGTPSTPVLGNYLGQLKATWDGLLVGGIAPPVDFNVLEVHVSTSTGFTPSSSTLKANMSTAGSVYIDTAYGTTQFVKFIAVDFTGNKSPASSQASGTSTQVVSSDILDAAVTAGKIAAAAVGSTQLVDASVIQAKIGTGAVGNSQLASLAVQTANIADAAIVTAKIADLSVNTAKIVDLSVSTAKIANLAVSTAQIADAAIVTAKIGTLAVNDAQIGSLAAGKITAGTMTADVVMSGRFATALTGARVELNSAGLQKWDASNNQLVSITGSTNLLTGTFKTALTGRRIEIGVSGTTGQINFTDASGGALGNVIAYTATGSIEVISLTAPIAGTGTAYNSVIVQGNERIYSISNLVSCQYVGASSAFGIDYINAKSAGTTFSRYVANEAGGHVWLTGSAVQRLAVTPNSLLYSRSDGTQIISFVDGASSNRMVWMPTGSTHGSVQFLDNGGGTTASPRLNLAQQDGDGNIVKGFGGHTEIRNNADSLFAEIVAGVFTVGSDRDSKTNITDATVDAVAKVRGMRARSYQRRRKDNNGNDLPPGPPELGLIAQEAPAEIVSTTTTSDGQAAINLYAYATVLAAAVQQLDTRLQAVEKKGPPA